MLAHYKSIYAFLFNLGFEESLAADLTQETFLSAWQGIADFRGKASLSTWLHRIAYNKFVDSKRAMERRNAGAEQLQARQRDRQEEAGPLDQLLLAERSQCLRNAIGKLDGRDAVVIVLHYLQGLSFREMAATLDEPAGTIKWRTSRALARLRDILDGTLAP